MEKGIRLYRAFKNADLSLGATPEDWREALSMLAGDLAAESPSKYRELLKNLQDDCDYNCSFVI